jgi:hypothetical protein
MMNKSGLDTTPLFYNNINNLLSSSFISRTTLLCELLLGMLETTYINSCEINVKIKTENEIETDIPSLKK